MKRMLAALFAGVLALSLTACGGGQSEDPAQDGQQDAQEAAQAPDLTGEWKTEENNGAYQGAYITDDTIEVYWVTSGDDGDSVALYWAGSYTPPSDAKEPYTWESANDTDRTSAALLASGDATKDFTYQGGKISYSVTVQGVTRALELEKAEWGYGEKSNGNAIVDALFNGGSTSGSGETMVGSGDLGDYHVEIKGASLAKDYEGNSAIVITYTWTNNSDGTTNAMVSMMEKAFQDGVQLDTAIVAGLSDSMRDVRPGTTIDIEKAFSLTSDTSTVELEITEFMSFSNDMVTAEFNPAELGT